jgi:ABC-type multidrug transport system fused ATPase/permease subunit
MLRLGATKPLLADDIWRIDETFYTSPVEAVEGLIADGNTIGFRLITSGWALIKVFWKKWVLGGCWRFLRVIIQGGTPLVLNSFLDWLETDKDDPNEPIWKGLGTSGLIAGLAFWIGLMPILDVFCMERSIWLNVQLSHRMKSTLLQVVHRKLLRRKSTGLKELTLESPVDIGNIVASDIDRIYEAMEALHWLWQTPLLLLVTLYVLWYLSISCKGPSRGITHVGWPGQFAPSGCLHCCGE